MMISLGRDSETEWVLIRRYAKERNGAENVEHIHVSNLSISECQEGHFNRSIIIRCLSTGMNDRDEIVSGIGACHLLRYSRSLTFCPPSECVICL